MDKEFEKLRQLQEELDAMKKLGADRDIIEKQFKKISKQERKIYEAFDKEIKSMEEKYNV